MVAPNRMILTSKMTKMKTKINVTLEWEKFMIACRAFFPKCKFTGLDLRGPNLFMDEVKYAPGKHAWASIYLNRPGDEPNKTVWLEEPVYKLDYEIDKRSYATRQNQFYTTDLAEFAQKLKELKRVDV